MIKAEEQIMRDINFLCSIDEAFAESPDDVDTVLQTCRIWVVSAQNISIMSLY